MPKHPSNYSSVTLSTWGTHHHGGNGMAHFLDAGFFGGNVGHAAIEITLPADKEGQALVQKYCMEGKNKTIPFERTTQNYMDENGKVKQHEAYKIYFSWWPGNNNGYSLRPNLNNDNMHERTGVDVGPDVLNQREQRTYRGVLGSRKVHLANKEIRHLSSLTEEQRYLLTMQSNLKETEDKIGSILLLEEKLKNKGSAKVDGSLLSLLNTQLPDWKDLVTEPKVLQAADIQKINQRISERKDELGDERDINITKMEYAKAVVESTATQALEAEVKDLREALALLPPPQQALMIQQKDERFSIQAWVHYELAEVTKVLEPAQSVAVYCLMNNFNVNKEKILEVLFDKKYPDTLKDRGNIEQWRQFLPPEHQHVTRETMTAEIFQALQKNAKAVKEEYIAKQNLLFAEQTLVNKTSSFQQGDHERFVTRGLSPDNQVNLPVGGIKTDEHHKLGLNIESMLKQMQQLTKDGKDFNIATKNCSATTGAILTAGAEPNLRSYFQEKALSGFGTPQAVFNGALQYQHAITQNQGKMSFWEKLNRWNPLNVVSYLGGAMLNKAASPETPILGKVALGIGLLPVGALAVGVETVKAIFNPKKTFTNCRDFVNYAWNNNSIFLKLCSIPAAIMTVAMAIPAALQWGVQKVIVEPITRTTQQRAKELQAVEKGPIIVSEKLAPRHKANQVDDPLAFDNPIVNAPLSGFQSYKEKQKVTIHVPKDTAKPENHRPSTRLD